MAFPSWQLWARDMGKAKTDREISRVVDEIAVVRDDVMSWYDPNMPPRRREALLRVMEVGSYALEGPITARAMSDFSLAASLPRIGIFTPGTRRLNDRVCSDLSKLRWPADRFDTINNHMATLASYSMPRSLVDMTHESVNEYVVSEFLLQSRAVDAIYRGLPLDAIPEKTLGDVVNTLLKGHGSGYAVLARMAEVLPATIIQYKDMEPWPDHLRTSLSKTEVVRAMMRIKGGEWSNAVQRLAVGCTEACYSTDRDAIMRDSPHAEMLELDYDNNIDEFHDEHAADCWYEVARWIMTGDTSTDAHLFPAFSLSKSSDPKLLAAGAPNCMLGTLLGFRRTFGCPLMFGEGPDIMTGVAVDAYGHPILWDHNLRAALKNETPNLGEERTFYASTKHQRGGGLIIPETYSGPLVLDARTALEATL